MLTNACESDVTATALHTYMCLPPFEKATQEKEEEESKTMRQLCDKLI